MRKFSTILLLLLFAVTGIHAQVTWGEQIRVEKNAVVKTVLKNQNHFFIVRTINTKKQRGISIEKFNSGTLIREKNIFFKNPVVPNASIIYEKVTLNYKSIHWFFSAYNRTTKIHELYRIEIPLELDNQSSPEKLDEYNIEGAKSIPGYTLHESENRLHYLAIRKFPFDKYANEKYLFIMMDSAMQVKWKKEIELPYANNLFDINEKLIDLDGNVHLLATLSPEKEKGDFFSRRIASNKYLMISFYPAENKLKEFDITLDSKFITSVTAGVNPAGNIAIGGFYSNSNQFALAGTFYFLFSPQTKKIISVNQKAFEKEFMMEFMSEKSASKGEELNDFYFDHFLLNKDGSALMVAEEYYRQTYSYYDPYNQLYYNNNTYNFNAIIVVKVNAGGAIEWTRKINKKQISNTGSNEYYSYTLAKGDSSLILLYNDHPANLKEKNLESDRVQSLTNSRFSTPTQVTIAANGTTKKEKFYDSNKDNLTLIPTLCRQLDEKTYLVCRQRKSILQFGIINL